MSVKLREELNEKPAKKLGTSKEYAIEQLREKRPDLLERVVNGELSANAAMVEAGLRKQSVTIPLSKDIVDTLQKRADEIGIKRATLIQNYILEGIDKYAEQYDKEESDGE